MGTDLIVYPSFTPIFHVLTSVDRKAITSVTFFWRGGQFGPIPPLTVQQPKPPGEAGRWGWGWVSRCWAICWLFWNDDSLTDGCYAWLAQLSSPCPRLQATSTPVPVPQKATWPRELVSHDCLAEWKAKYPHAAPFSPCRVPRGKRTCSFRFFS